MGRDDDKPVPGLQGGTAPARAFSEFMRVAVARRPVENFQLEVPLPDWQLEPDEEVWGNTITEAPLVDEDGNPIAPADPVYDPATGAPVPQQPDGGPDQQWLDEVLDRNQPPQRAPPPPAGRPPPPSAPRDPLEPRPDSAQF